MNLLAPKIALGRAPEEIHCEHPTTAATWSVVIFVDRPPARLQDQIQSLSAQTIPPAHIFVVTSGADRSLLSSPDPRITTIEINQPVDCLSAFAVALNCPTEYICLIDNHPAVFGSRWYEWVVQHNESYEGIYGIEGTRYPGQRVDSAATSPLPLHVDCLHGLWFLRKDHLKALWKETTPLERADQDVHIGYVFQKHLKLNSFVLPSPSDPNRQSFFSSVRPDPDSAVYERHRALGFETILERETQLRDYDNSLGYFLSKIVKKEPFALIRYGDGEYFIATGQTYRSAVEDNWRHANTDSILKDHLTDTFRLHRSNAYYGIHAACDVALYREYCLRQIPTRANLTFATVFCNKNFLRFKEFVEQHSFNVVVIASALPLGMKIGGLGILDSYVIDETLVARWDREYTTHLQHVTDLAIKHENEVFFVAAGPVGKVFIHRMYQANPYNIYCDIGSALDLFTKGTPSRAYYFPGTPDSQHTCHF